MHYVGLDVHKSLTAVCILNEGGKVVKRKSVFGRGPKVVEYLSKLDEPFEVVFEASCGYGWWHRAIGDLRMARRVVVADPGQLRLIFRSKRKTDALDAEKLAKLLLLDAVPTVHVPHEDVQAWRRIIQHRSHLVSKRTRCKNSIRALLRTHQIEAPKSLWSKKNMVWLSTVEFDSMLDAVQRNMSVEQLELLNKQIKTVEKVLDDIGDRSGAVAVLRTIPGVGPRTSEAVAAYIDDASRFRRNRQIGSYFGLVPCEDSSAGKQRLGHITRQGPSLVRRLLCEAAWQAIRRDVRVRERYLALKQGDKQRRKIALVVTAHYLLRAMQAMLISGEVWREAS